MLALYVHETREGFVTYLMGVETNPPRDGRQDWWRRVIRPRLEELLE